MPDTLVCPACGHVAPFTDFVPPKLKSTFAEQAFVILTIVSILAVLKGLGVIR